VDDPLARDDIASWCRLAGHELLAAVEEGPRLRVFLRKKPD
jgi:TusA-related sulfurtransferase